MDRRPICSTDCTDAEPPRMEKHIPGKSALIVTLTEQRNISLQRHIFQVLQFKNISTPHHISLYQIIIKRVMLGLQLYSSHYVYSGFFLNTESGGKSNPKYIQIFKLYTHLVGYILNKKVYIYWIIRNNFPGYSGFVPTSQNYHGASYSNVSGAALNNFHDNVRDYKAKECCKQQRDDCCETSCPDVDLCCDSGYQSRDCDNGNGYNGYQSRNGNYQSRNGNYSRSAQSRADSRSGQGRRDSGSYRVQPPYGENPSDGYKSPGHQDLMPGN